MSRPGEYRRDHYRINHARMTWKPWVAKVTRYVDGIQIGQPWSVRCWSEPAALLMLDRLEQAMRDGGEELSK